jgi:hypothetical protein
MSQSYCTTDEKTSNQMCETRTLERTQPLLPMIDQINTTILQATLYAKQWRLSLGSRAKIYPGAHMDG